MDHADRCGSLPLFVRELPGIRQSTSTIVFSIWFSEKTTSGENYRGHSEEQEGKADQQFWGRMFASGCASQKSRKKLR
jgi:hypothetical protein